ncbi:hypothetical protein DERP_003598 [Dermatophagoides pteronyssinus]|uniref:Uncharacterized protein n=1 Tax=Dermatophagoides pteronyssinus TaxID=6956 RepID=A0ABQ8JL28_DERPT|nr:hypothetical protein DERP_003598 [Dermatophagoides pteronyssinus]
MDNHFYYQPHFRSRPKNQKICACDFYWKTKRIGSELEMILNRNSFGILRLTCIHLYCGTAVGIVGGCDDGVPGLPESIPDPITVPLLPE